MGPLYTAKNFCGCGKGTKSRGSKKHTKSSKHTKTHTRTRTRTRSCH